MMISHDGVAWRVTAWRDLGMSFDEALGVLSAVTRLGSETPREWIETARATFTTLKAAPLLALLESAVEAGNGRSRPDPQGDGGARAMPPLVQDAVAST